MSGVELLHQPGRAFVIYVPQACYYSRDAGHQESLRQTAQSLIASLVTKTRAAARENDQARSFRLQAVDLVSLKRAVEGDPIRSLFIRGGMTFVSQHDRGEHRGLVIAQRVRGQMDDLIIADLLDERAFGSLPPVQYHALRVVGLDVFKLLLRRWQETEFGEKLLIETRVAETEKRLRFALRFALGVVEGAGKHTRARVGDECEILDQVAFRFRRDQRGERQILQHAVRRNAECEVLIELSLDRRDQQFVQIGR